MGQTFQCPECDHQATQKGDLVRHQKAVHIGQKFRALETTRGMVKSYCIHAQAACMLWDFDELKSKYDEKDEDLELVCEDPYLVVANVGEVPAN